MNDGAREQRLDALKRYEEARRAHLGGAINLVFGLATAASGFCISHIVDAESEFSTPGSYFFVCATAIFVVTIALCVLSTWTRLRDFRLTARKLRLELREADAVELQRLHDTTNMLGKWTWRLFYAQLIAFATGVVLLAAALCFLYFHHVFPKTNGA